MEEFLFDDDELECDEHEKQKKKDLTYAYAWFNKSYYPLITFIRNFAEILKTRTGYVPSHRLIMQSNASSLEFHAHMSTLMRYFLYEPLRLHFGSNVVPSVSYVAENITSCSIYQYAEVTLYATVHAPTPSVAAMAEIIEHKT